MRQFRTPVKVVLFLSSYVPLFLIIALKLGSVPPLLIDGFQPPYLPIPVNISYLSSLIVVLCVIITWLLYRMIRIHSERGITQKPVDKYQKRNELLSTYLLVYVFVFAGLDFTVLLDLFIFAFFFVLLGVLQINSEILHVNPMLGVRGYEVYEVDSNEEVMLVITNAPINEKIIPPESQVAEEQRQKIEVVELGNTTYLTP